MSHSHKITAQSGYSLLGITFAFAVIAGVLTFVWSQIDRNIQSQTVQVAVKEVASSLLTLQANFGAAAGFTRLSAESAGLSTPNVYRGSVSACGKTPADGLGRIGAHELECLGPEEGNVRASDPNAPFSFGILQWDGVPLSQCYDLVVGTEKLADEIWLVNMQNRYKVKAIQKSSLTRSPELCRNALLATNQALSIRWIISK